MNIKYDAIKAAILANAGELTVEVTDGGDSIISKDINGCTITSVYYCNDEPEYDNGYVSRHCYEYDNGRVTHKIMETDDGVLEQWNEYDVNGNKIHFKNCDAREKLWEYDDDNNKIHYKYFYEEEVYDEQWWMYDTNRNLTYFKDSNIEKLWEYDANNHLRHYKDSNRRELWYNSLGHITNKDELDAIPDPSWD